MGGCISIWFDLNNILLYRFDFIYVIPKEIKFISNSFEIIIDKY